LFIGRFIDQTFYVAECVRARVPLGRRSHRLRTIIALRVRSNTAHPG